MIRTTPLADQSKKQLADLAKRRGVSGWESMSKEQLLKVLAKTQKAAAPRPAAKPAHSTARKPAPRVAAKGAKRPVSSRAKATPTAKARPSRPPEAKPPVNKAKPASPKVPPLPVKPSKVEVRPPRPVARPLTARVEAIIPADKDLSTKNAKIGNVKDQIVLTAPDPYWIHAFWELSLQAVQRAEAALGQDWHGAKPILRLFDVTSQDTTSTSEAPLRDILVHGGCTHWYIDVPQPTRSFRVDIGYVTRAGRFFILARSNVIVPPKVGAGEQVEVDLSSSKEDPQPRQINEETLRRPTKESPFGSGAAMHKKLKKFFFDIDAELIVFGETDPTATVTLQNEPVKISPQGTFTMRLPLPDSRQIIPVVATSSDGMEEQTIVLAIERNIKRLDPMTHDLYNEP